MISALSSFSSSKAALGAAILAVVVCRTAVCAAPGGLSLGMPFSDNLVLQRGAPAHIWGKAGAGQRVTLTFASQTRSAVADASGAWHVSMDPMPANSQPQTLALSTEGTGAASDALKCTNVVVGDVWIAAGQSNMEFPMANEAHAAAELPSATCPELRFLNLSFAGQFFYAKPFGSNELARMVPERFYTGAWKASTPSSAKSFSAVSYYFGREVQKELKVPVGIIHMAVGGSPAEAWIRRATLQGHPELRELVSGNWLTNSALDDWCRQRGRENFESALRQGTHAPGDDIGPNHHFKPGFLWDAGPAQLLPMQVCGVLWYQGESNSLEPRRVTQHEKLFPLLVQDWRAHWKAPSGRGELPFLYCQLSSISTNGGYKSSSWPEFRDQQRRFLEFLPGTAMAVTSDLGHPTDVHPRNKRDVGHRLALAALARVYGRPIEYSGPLIINATVTGGRVILHFNHAKGLRTTDGKAPNGFEVSDGAGGFHKADAVIEDDRVILKRPGVSRPAAVRYLWQPFPVPVQNLVNGAGLPASTFRVKVQP